MINQAVLIFTLTSLALLSRFFVIRLKSADEDVFATELERAQGERREREEKKQIRHEAEVKDLLERADRSLARKQYGTATKEYRQVLAKDPESVLALAALGAILLKEESYDSALELLEKAHRLDSLEPSVLANIGLVYFAKKDYEKAADSLEHSLAIENQNARRHMNLALVYREMGNRRKYLAELKKAASIEKSKAYLELLGEEYLEQKKIGPARNAFGELLALDPSNLKAKQALSRIRTRGRK